MPTRSWLKQQEWKNANEANRAAEALAREILENAPDAGEGSLPEGLHDALILKTKLQTELREAVAKPVVVSVDLVEEEWVFVVWGDYRPPFTRWNGYSVYYKPSSSVGPGQL